LAWIHAQPLPNKIKPMPTVSVGRSQNHCTGFESAVQQKSLAGIIATMSGQNSCATAAKQFDR